MPLKERIKNKIPNFLLRPIQNLHAKYLNTRRIQEENKMIARQPQLHQKAIEKINTKSGAIKIVFFVLFDSVWKYDEVFKILQQDERFNPTILVCPISNYSYQNMIDNMNRCYDLFSKKGYHVIKSFNSETGEYLDVKAELKPDLIFYTSPYEGLIDDRYYIKNFTDILTIYVDYFFSEGINFKYSSDLLLHNLVWRRYSEHQEHYNACQKSRNKGINAVYSGYPGTDCFIKKGAKFKDNWKIKKTTVKRIIWAPHHTITDYAFVNYSTFLSYCDFMFEMAEKYRDEIQICFKPHPILKNRLDIEWGKEKSEEYYNKWATLPNGMLNDGEYEDLFMTSDAMIHDCGSFIGEYLFTKKPAMFLTNGEPFEKKYNNTARNCLSNYYIGRSKKDIESFILNVINNEDPLKNQRISFVEKELMPPNGKLASENIVDDIIKGLGL